LICHRDSSFRESVKNIIMHEIRIAEDLSAIVLETAGKEKLSKVTKVNISFGQLVQIVPDIFEFAFRESVRNSIAEEAEVDIEIIPVKMKCINCGKDFQVKENRFACNICNSTDLLIISGNELFIKSIEGD
jgi:hydrogenase nickel incorporation protein HypA/HybF